MFLWRGQLPTWIFLRAVKGLTTEIEFFFFFFLLSRRVKRKKESLEENGVPTKATSTALVFCLRQTVINGEDNIKRLSKGDFRPERIKCVK